jgi:2-polyprenyl-3-methyl-5-hydroxy-6-metoxy-1,4-benzoquinol methylase
MKKNVDFIKIVDFLQLCIEVNFTNYMDFGAGIGSNALLFNEYGFSITLADISDAMIKYEKWRLKRHKVIANFIDLKKQKMPVNFFDCATAIEVLEHVKNPVAVMNQIKNALKPGGYVFVTTPFYKDPERPQHIIHNMTIAKEFEELGMKLISENNEELYRIFKKI